MKWLSRILVVLALAAMVLAAVSSTACTPVPPPGKVGAIDAADPEYVLVLNIDTSGSMFAYLNDGRVWTAVNSLFKQFFRAAKWQRHLSGDGDILVVALTESRMHRLRASAEPVKDRALFTTFDRLRSNMAEPWIDCYGKATGL